VPHLEDGEDRKEQTVSDGDEDDVPRRPCDDDERRDVRDSGDDRPQRGLAGVGANGRRRVY